MVRIETVYQTKNPAYTRERAAQHIGILVHTTGAVNKNLKRYVDAPELLGVNEYKNHWNNTSADKCMHAFIGLDKNKEVMVVQTLPYDFACSGCGKGSKGSFNYNPTAHIQFEICQGSDSDADYYWKAIAAAEEYCAHLCKLFGWAAVNITSHYEAAKQGYASNHADPAPWMKCFGDSMDKFRTRVAALLENEEEHTLNRYEVTGTQLALRAKPTTTAAVLVRMPTGTIVDGEPATSTWTKLSYTDKNGKRYTGYSSSKYLSIIEEAVAPSEEPDDAEKLDILWAWYKKEGGAK